MSVKRVSVREARERFCQLLDQVQAGDEVIVLRRGIEVGKLIRPQRAHARFPDLSLLRASVNLRGIPLSQQVARERRRTRY